MAFTLGMSAASAVEKLAELEEALANSAGSATLVARMIVSVLDPRFAGGATGDGATDDTASITAAVAGAYLSGEALLWPDGTYVTTQSIPNLHKVKHQGSGVIKRGSALFYVEPRGTQANTINVATTGAAGNDGLSSGQAMSTFQAAFDALNNYGPMLSGFWNVVAAAGTYDFSAGAQTLTTASQNRVTVRGPSVGGHPNVPTCIINGAGGGTYSHGLRAANSYVTFREIKAINFTAAPGGTRIGFLADVGSDVWTDNCHTASGCDWAGVFASSATIRVSGGIYDGAQWGIGVYNSRFTIGYNGTTLSNRPIVKNCTQVGISAQALAMGHIDYCDLTDNPTQILLDGNSRAHIMGCTAVRGTYHVQAQGGSRYYDDVVTPNAWNIGTASAATSSTFIAHAESGETSEGSSSQSYRRVAYDRVFRTVTGTTPTTLTTPYTIKADRMRGVGKSCRVVIQGTYTVSAGSSISVALGGMTLALSVPAAATSEVFNMEVELLEVQGGYRAFGKLVDSMTAARMGSTGTGFSNTVDQAITISCTLTGASDTLNIYRTDVYLMG